MLWLLVSVGLYIGWFILLNVARPDIRLENFLSAALQGMRFYLPVILVAMAVPGALYLVSPRLAWLWSWIFLSASILLPGLALALIRAQYVSERAREMYIEGKGLWAAFALLSLIGLYAAIAATAFASAAKRDAGQGGYRQGQLAVAAIALILHATILVSNFGPFFAFVYR